MPYVPVPPPAPISLPKLAWLEQQQQPFDDEGRAAKFAEVRIIRAGLDSWKAIAKAESFDSWKAVGKALEIGRTHALRVSGSNRPMGRNYCRAFSAWITKHGFGAMPKSTRSVAIELSENIAAIEHWRMTLSDKQRRRLIHPLSNVSRWRKVMKQQRQPDPAKAATAAWRRFIVCMERLPRDQAQPLWQAIQAQATAASSLLPS